MRKYNLSDLFSSQYERSPSIREKIIKKIISSTSGKRDSLFSRIRYYSFATSFSAVAVFVLLFLVLYNLDRDGDFVNQGPDKTQEYTVKEKKDKEKEDKKIKEEEEEEEEKQSSRLNSLSQEPSKPSERKLQRDMTMQDSESQAGDDGGASVQSMETEEETKEETEEESVKSLGMEKNFVESLEEEGSADKDFGAEKQKEMISQDISTDSKSGSSKEQEKSLWEKILDFINSFWNSMFG